jgi:hypothetical protein
MTTGDPATFKMMNIQKQNDVSLSQVPNKTKFIPPFILRVDAFLENSVFIRINIHVKWR